MATLNKLKFPDIRAVYSQVSEAVGLELDPEGSGALKDGLRDLAATYLLAEAGERIRFKPSEVAARIRKISTRIEDTTSRVDALSSIPDDIRVLVAHHGPTVGEFALNLQTVDELIAASVIDEAACSKLLLLMKRTPAQLGKAKAGRPRHGAQAYALVELERLLFRVYGDRVTQLTDDEERILKPSLFLHAARTFFRAVDNSSPDVQRIWRTMRRSRTH